MIVTTYTIDNGETEYQTTDADRAEVESRDGATVTAVTSA